MQFFWHYGWIHWDPIGQTWHTVTGYELGPPDQEADAGDEPGPVDEHGPGDEPGPLELREAVPLPAAAGWGGFAGRGGFRPPHPYPDENPAAEAARQEPVPVEAAPEVPVPVHDGPAPIPAGGAQQPLIPGDSSQWDADHKRDEDRADAQHALENTRWDTQHALDNSRWDTRHTLENARWDTQHALDNSRWDTRHTLENTRWDTQHALDNSRWDTRHTLENTRWDSYLALKRGREDTALAVDSTLLEAVHNGYVTVTQGSLDRAVQRATYVTTAAGAVATLYTAILAARFSASHPPSARSIIPALFVGGAVAFSTWYMAFLRGHTRKQNLLPAGSGGNIAETRLLDFMEWTFSGVLARAWSLRLSVISLALGLALLPIGFIQLSTAVTWLIGLAALVLLLLWIGGEFYVAVKGPPRRVKKFLDRLHEQSPKLAFERPLLPAAPTGSFADTGLGSFGLLPRTGQQMLTRRNLPTWPRECRRRPRTRQQMLTRRNLPTWPRECRRRPRTGRPALTRRNLPTWPRERRLRNPTRSHPASGRKISLLLALYRSRWSFEPSTMAMAGTHEG
jgi:hypothetical protein